MTTQSFLISLCFTTEQGLVLGVSITVRIKGLH